MMQDSSLTTSYIYDGDTRAKLSLWGGDYYWEFINDPAASIPAVLVSKGHTDLETTYVYYVREPGGELLASFDSAETPNTLYYHFDDLGSTVLTTDGSGGDLGHSTYRAWGWPTTSDPGPYLFCGRLGYYEHTQDQNWLEQSSLLQLGVRFYDRDTGRFTQRDPARQGISWYEYAGGDPVSAADPSGRLFWTDPSTGQPYMLFPPRDWLGGGIVLAFEANLAYMCLQRVAAAAGKLQGEIEWGKHNWRTWPGMRHAPYPMADMIYHCWAGCQGGRCIHRAFFCHHRIGHWAIGLLQQWMDDQVTGGVPDPNMPDQQRHIAANHKGIQLGLGNGDCWKECWKWWAATWGYNKIPMQPLPIEF